MPLPTSSKGTAGRLLFTSIVALSLATSPLHSAAEPAATEPRPSAAATSTVTLLTGDRVTLGPGADGQPTVQVEPRADRPEHLGFSVRREGPGQVSVIPSDVAPLVPDVLDPALFDVTGLVEMGYDDAHRADLPVIVRQSSRAGSPLVSQRTLGSIGATAGTIAKGNAAAFTTSLRAAGTTKVWLDRKLRASSVTGPEAAPRDGYLDQVKAPEAWETGLDGRGVKVAVLDTGVDAGHPALAGRVTTQADFTDGDGPADGNGHGTHVASLVAGSGAGSDGARQGIAPAAELLSGKVLADDGFGQESWVIAGMEWAAAQDADIVNLSLSGVAGEGDDIVAAALDRLTAQTGSLFVVAAGNSGGLGASPFTIGTPGIAASALTVGAVTATDGQAGFSSEGPTRGSYRLKPEVVAPGVNIPGARAGARDGDLYVGMTGTSQATPIVAGAAALLLQQEPGRSWQQLKARLTGTADPARVWTAWTHGSGRLDLQHAISPGLAADLGTLDLGTVRHPDEAPRSRTVTFTNSGSEPLTFSLTDQQRSVDGEAAPAGAVVAEPATLTLPAGGSASSTVTVDPGLLADGTWEGHLEAVTPDQRKLLHVALTVFDEQPRYDLTVRVLDRTGTPVAGGVVTTFNAVTGGFRQLTLDETGTAKVRTDRGYYSMFAQIITPAGPGRPETFAVAGSPEVDVTADASYTIDARKAEPLRAATVERQPTKVVEAAIMYSRHSDTRGYTEINGFTPEEIQAGRIFVQPTTAVAHGDFEATTRWRLEPTGQVRSGDPEVYELIVPRDRFTLPLAPRIDRRALGDMARVETTFGSYSGTTEQEAGRIASTVRTGVRMLTWRPVDVPSKRVELLTTEPGTTWSQCLRTPATGPNGLCEYPSSTVYRPGQRAHSVFGTALHPQVGNPFHSPTTLFADIDLGDAFHVANLDGNAVEDARLALYRNGNLIADEPGLFAYFPVPNGSARFRLEQSWNLRPEAFPTSRRAKTTWEFTSAPPPDPTQASASVPSLLTIGYDAGLDGYGRATAWRPLGIDLRIGHLEGSVAHRITGARLWYSTDDGTRWSAASVLRTKDGYRAMVPPWVLRSGVSLSIRATATDAGGGSIDQQVIGMIPVR